MPHSKNHSITQGMLFALCGFALLALGDSVVKSMAGLWPGPAIAALRYFFGLIGLASVLALREGRVAFICPRPWLQAGRGLAVSVASVAFFISVFVMPLAEATVIQFTTPMIVALLSSLFLGERAPRAAWMATIMAFAGVLLVIRPDASHLGWSAVLPLIAALGMACLILLNRVAASTGSALSMQFLVALFATPVLIGFALLGDVSGIAAFALSWPPLSVIIKCAIISVTASSAHMLIYMATTRASAAVIAPMVYVQLVVALGVGFILYNELPDRVALFGSFLIIGAGLYLWHSQRAPHDSRSQLA